MLAEKQHALAEAEAQSERARRERLEAAAVRQRAEQEARIDRQREQVWLSALVPAEGVT